MCCQSVRLLLVSAMLFVSLRCPVFAQDADADPVRLLILAPQGPVFAELRISVARRPYRAWVARFLAQRLDVDQSGGLSARELERIPERLRRSLGAESEEHMLLLLKQAGLLDGDISVIPVDQFTQWFREALNDETLVRAESVPPAQAVRLGVLVDTSGNGGVSVDELQAGISTLRFRDLDDDQTLSAAELLPFRDPRRVTRVITPDAADLPFVQLRDQASRTRAAELIVQRYGRGESSITLPLLRTHPSFLQEHDQDTDGQLNQAELQSYLQTEPVHLTWDIQLSDQAAQSRIRLTSSPYARRFTKHRPLRRGRAEVTIDELPIEVRSWGGARSARRGLIGFLGQHFSRVDEDRSNTLSEEEFTALQGSIMEAEVNMDFHTADLDEDQQLSRKELTAAVETDIIATQSQIEVSIRQDGKTLFSVLDRNQDRRLAQREMQECQAVVEQWDTDQDGEVVETELGTGYVLKIGLGQPDNMRQGMISMTMDQVRVDAILPGVDNLTGPQWFRRMDRNQDGDLSRREFHGTREQFDQLDTDSDDLIDADEAARLTQNEDQADRN